MKTEEHFFTDTRKKVKEYLEDWLLLLKLQTIEKASKIIAVIFSGVVITVLAFLILIFLSITGGYYFAELTGSMYWGFGIITGIYILLLIIIFAIRKKIADKFIHIFINIFFENTR